MDVHSRIVDVWRVEKAGPCVVRRRAKPATKRTKRNKEKSFLWFAIRSWHYFLRGSSFFRMMTCATTTQKKVSLSRRREERRRTNLYDQTFKPPCISLPVCRRSLSLLLFYCLILKSKWKITIIKYKQISQQDVYKHMLGRHGPHPHADDCRCKSSPLAFDTNETPCFFSRSPHPSWHFPL